MTEPRILLCVNDSVESRQAVQSVASRPWPKGTEIRILTVIDPADYSIVGLLDDRIREIRRFHQLLTNEFSETPVFCTSSIKEGDPLTTIVEEAEQWKPTRLFLGGRKQSRFSRWIHGSLSSAVEARTACPVELIGHQRRRFKSFSRLAIATVKHFK